MLWLNYLRQDGEAYADLKAFLETEKQHQRELYDTAPDMVQVNKIQGKVEYIVELQLAVTQEERGERERLNRIDREQREQRGESRTC